MFERVLIANRGEIACRIAATLRRMGITSIAVHTDADAGARHTREADVSVAIGPPRAYLDIGAIIKAAHATGARAIHPGYGFLAENPELAEACESAGIAFVGPAPATLRAMGSKLEAKRLMAAAGVPVVPGYHGNDQSDDRLAEAAGEVGFPLMIKAAAGGGGKGMRIVHREGDFTAALQGARRESIGAFGDQTMILERYLEKPRHVEFQVFGDQHGTIVHLGERECSTQRRYQKVLEEAPSPALKPEMRAAMGEAAVAAARAVDYVGAGTVEFIMDASRDFYFMEMNTRLQVEHPVTEMVRGIDLVQWQLDVAAGGRLPSPGDLPAVNGHAIEARIYAEDPYNGFLPSTGEIECFEYPAGETGLRVDAGIAAGDTVTIHYDPMLAKVIAHGDSRPAALQRLRAALARIALIGPRNNLSLLQALTAHPEFANARVDTTFLDAELDAILASIPRVSEGHLSAAAAALLNAQTRPADASDPHSPWDGPDGWESVVGSGVTLRLGDASGEAYVVSLTRARVASGQGGAAAIADASEPDIPADGTAGGVRDYHTRIAADRVFVTDGTDGRLLQWLPRYADDKSHLEEDTHPGAPMPGTVVKILVAPGDPVSAGDPLLVLEGMKMEYTLKASCAGVIAKVLCAEGDMVEADAPLVDLAADESGS
jgi:3-methylcrotonyl-CoA carboxylase alpha subunit